MQNANKKTEKKWVKKRHAAVFAFFRPIFRLYLKLRYNYKATSEEKKTPKGALIFCNHTTVLDPFMMAISFKRPIYYMMNDDLFTLGFLSSVIRFLVNPVPKSKSKSDLNAVRTTFKVLKEGGTVGIFPEGNRTLSGDNWEIDDSAAKLAKAAKVPLVLYKIKGGYGSDPRWGGGVRKGRMTGEIVKIIYPEQLEKTSVKEVMEEITEGLKTEDLSLGWKFKSKKRAEFLERSLYCCPNCGALNGVYTAGKNIFCKQCDFIAEYTEDLKIKKIRGELFGNTTSEWFTAQKVKLKEIFDRQPSDKKFFEDEAKIRFIRGRKRKSAGKAKIFATKERVEVSGKNVKKTLEFAAVDGATVLGKRKINFYLEDGSIFQIKGSKRFNAIKYLHLYQIATKGENV